MSAPRPPALARWLLETLPRPEGDFVSADLEEEYTGSVLPERGAFRARLWFWGQTVRTLLAFAKWRRHRGVTPAAPPLLREVRHAYRGLRRRPGFALVAILTLAVGIGATTSVFSLANAVLFQPISGVARQDELVTIGFEDVGDGTSTGISVPNLHDLDAATPELVGIAGYQSTIFHVASDRLDARTAWGQFVSGEYFDLLGVGAARGRLFTAQEADDPDGPALAVLSDAFWRSAFGADPAAIGATLRVNGVPFTVVGVTPPAFRGVERLDSLDVWVPGATYVALRHNEGLPGWRLDSRSLRLFNHTLARLAPGAAPADAETRLRAAMDRLREAYPDENADYESFVPAVRRDLGLRSGDRESAEGILRILTALVGVILLVTSANVANLLVLQGTRRKGETAVRLALGATRSHLTLFHLAEALLIAVPAIALGLVVALPLLGALSGSGIFPEGMEKHVALDGSVFIFAAGVGLFTALFFGLLPSLLHTRTDPNETLKGTQRTTNRTASLLQGTLSVVQLSLSLALVGGATLLGQTVANLADVDVGFDADNVMGFQFNPSPQGYRGAEAAAFQRAVLDRARSIEGVEALTVSGFPPFGRLAMGLTVRHPVDNSRKLSVRADWVAEGFTDLLGVPVLAGRDFTRDEATTPSAGPEAALLSRTLAANLFGTPERALGGLLDVEVFGQPRAALVVGVVEDIVDGNLRRDPFPKLYLPQPSAPQPFSTLLLRTRRPLRAVTTDVRRVLADEDPDVPLVGSHVLADRMTQATARERTLVELAALLASIAVLLAGVGLYSVVAYAAAQRRREFGIRLAVGASTVRISRLVLARALAFGIGGIGLGLGVAWIGTRLLASVLYGVAPMDPLALGLAAAVLLLVALAASFMPALSATRVDPATTLRVE